MTELTRAITSHDLAGISAAVVTWPEQISEAVNGWLPIEWARRTGNPFTYARAIRLLEPKPDSSEYVAVLKKYVISISGNYFGGGSPEASAKRVWEQLYKGFVRPFSKDLPDFVLNEEQKKDLEYLLSVSGIHSEGELVALVTKNA